MHLWLEEGHKLIRIHATAQIIPKLHAIQDATVQLWCKKLWLISTSFLGGVKRNIRLDQ